MPGRRAGSPFAVYARVQCREPKTGQEKVQFYCEDDLLFLSSYYLSMHLNKANIFKNKLLNYYAPKDVLFENVFTVFRHPQIEWIVLT